jgi:hypothetical protein
MLDNEPVRPIYRRDGTLSWYGKRRLSAQLRKQHGEKRKLVFKQERPMKISLGGFIGIAWRKDVEMWQARVRVKCQYFSLGYYETEREAAAEYNAGALYWLGETTWLNDIRPVGEKDERVAKLKKLQPDGSWIFSKR